MTRDDIIRMAQDAGIVVTGEAVWKLCEMVAAAEREACASILDRNVEACGMKCYICLTDLIWGGDDDSDDGEHRIVTNLSCPECGAFVLVYWSQMEEEE